MDMELLHIYLRYININENSSTKYARTVYLFFCAVIYFQINAVRLRSHTASWKKRHRVRWSECLHAMRRQMDG